MRYTVKWTPSAEKDFDEIVDYLLNNWTNSVAEKFLEITNSNIRLIQAFPTLFPEIHKKKKVRKCVLTKQNTLFYRVIKNEIHILRIFDTRQDDKKLHFKT